MKSNLIKFIGIILIQINNELNVLLEVIIVGVVIAQREVGLATWSIFNLDARLALRGLVSRLVKLINSYIVGICNIRVLLEIVEVIFVVVESVGLLRLIVVDLVGHYFFDGLFFRLIPAEREGGFPTLINIICTWRVCGLY